MLDLECPTCDCLEQHLCINCDSRINQKECNENNGYCEFCANQNKGDSNEQV